MEHVETGLPELLFADVIESTSVVLGQVFNGVEIARLGLGGQTPELQVFAPYGV